MSQLPLNLAPERKVWSVSELTLRVRDLLEAEFCDLWVEGEISNFREAQSGHYYFTLKDARAQLRCVCFRTQARLLKFRPEDGLHVRVRGSLSVYEARGEYQLYVDVLEPVGLGALQLAFEQLKRKLEAEGLFDPAHKKPLPLLPRRVGLITSPTGAAVRDILRVLRRRHPNLYLLLFPVRVQGEGAAREIAEAIAWFNRAATADVLIVARGGGSLEDLWAFNEEIVARAIFASRIPVISGVGHEIDFTIADFVADLRAPTPSAAAEMLVRTRQEFESHIAELHRRLVQQMRLLLSGWRQQFSELQTHRAFRRVEDRLREFRQRLDEAFFALGQALQRRTDSLRQRFRLAAARLTAYDFRSRMAHLRSRLEQRRAELAARAERLLTEKRHHLSRLRVQLDERSPLRVLERGYAIVFDAAGRIVRTSAQLAPGDPLRIQLARGRLTAEVKTTE
ncbi:MAG: exodeoxyribonuclease VII large subunit [Firmicutes bacterium]|nr:exodeoxyribonuclease VII large subunit [Bacillota bacterium]